MLTLPNSRVYGSFKILNFDKKLANPLYDDDIVKNGHYGHWHTSPRSHASRSRTCEKRTIEMDRIKNFLKTDDRRTIRIRKRTGKTAVFHACLERRWEKSSGPNILDRERVDRLLPSTQVVWVRDGDFKRTWLYRIIGKSIVKTQFLFFLNMKEICRAGLVSGSRETSQWASVCKGYYRRSCNSSFKLTINYDI